MVFSIFAFSFKFRLKIEFFDDFFPKKIGQNERDPPMLRNFPCGFNPVYMAL